MDEKEAEEYESYVTQVWLVLIGLYLIVLGLGLLIFLFYL